jgi:hypothetical protein
MAIKTRREWSTTWCEHYGGGNSNRVALDVVEEEAVDPGEVKMVMNLSNGCHVTCYKCCELNQKGLT